MPIKVTSWSVVFLKSKDPLGWVRPIWIITPPGFIQFIACFLVVSKPTVSKTISKWSLVIFLLSGLKQSASKYFNDLLRLLLSFRL